MAKIETRFLAGFLLFFSYNNSNTSAIILGKIFKSARILLKILLRLLPKFLKFWPKFLPKFVVKFWPKLVLQNTFIFYSHKDLGTRFDIQFQIFNTLLCAAYRKINVTKNGVIRMKHTNLGYISNKHPN